MVGLQYRNFGRSGFAVSTLGFGCMRLPVLEGDIGERAITLDQEESIQLIRYAIDQGINYLDTAYTYNSGLSETILGKALKDGYRAKVKVATKIPIWLAKEHADLFRMFEEQLQRLDVEYIDMYLLHMLSHMNWDMVRELRVFDFLNQLRREGKIKCVGFSFHDGFHLLEEIIAAYDWDFCYLQLNYLDEHYQAGLKGVKYAHSKGLGVVVMEPLRGGSLVRDIPPVANALWEKAEPRRSPADWGFRWVCNHPEVSAVLSGMNSFAQLEENLATFETALPNSLKEEELALIQQVKRIYQEKVKVNCTQCNYCMPCPRGVFIRGIFNFYNNASVFGKVEEAVSFYTRMKGMHKDFSACTGCGRCESRCPQHLPIRQLLGDADRAFETAIENHFQNSHAHLAKEKI